MLRQKHLKSQTRGRHICCSDASFSAPFRSTEGGTKKMPCHGIFCKLDLKHGLLRKKSQDSYNFSDTTPTRPCGTPARSHALTLPCIAHIQAVISQSHRDSQRCRPAAARAQGRLVGHQCMQPWTCSVSRRRDKPRALPPPEKVGGPCLLIGKRRCGRASTTCYRRPAG